MHIHEPELFLYHSLEMHIHEPELFLYLGKEAVLVHVCASLESGKERFWFMYVHL
jgi:hypothetical protein